MQTLYMSMFLRRCLTCEIVGFGHTLHPSLCSGMSFLSLTQKKYERNSCVNQQIDLNLIPFFKLYHPLIYCGIRVCVFGIKKSLKKHTIMVAI